MEKWEVVQEAPRYEVSNEGRVRNSKTGRIMNTSINTRGYMQVMLRNDGKYLNKRVHRLVAEAFCDGDSTNLDVNHIDGDKLNNHASNLEFCSRQANIRHAFDNGLKEPSRQTKVRVVETGEVYNSIRECGRHTGCNQSEICKCLSGKAPASKGYHFEKV